MIRLEGVTMQYGNHEPILKDVNLRLKPADFLFITGPSGSGKTTLLKHIYLAQKPFAGKVWMDQTDVYSQHRNPLAKFRQKIGVVFQEFRLMEHLTVLENVILPLRIKGRETPEHEMIDRAKEMLTWVGLENSMQVYPNALSGGQKQRVAIARAVINNPELIVADEPTGNIDWNMAQRIMGLFEELNRHGTTIVIATHSQTLLSTYPYPVLTLENGKIHDSRSLEIAA